jgi:hypothetical protein
MHTGKRPVLITVFGCLICQVLTCTSYRLVNVWKDPSYTDQPLSNLLIIAIRKDDIKRRIWEDAFTSGLTAHGINGVPSYSLFPAAPPDSDQIAGIMREKGFDGILLILKQPAQTNIHYVPPYVSLEPEVYYDTYWQRYRTYYQEVEQPGYTDSQKVAINRIDVSTTGNGGRLIWSATSRALEQYDAMGIQKAVADLVVDELIKRNIMGKKR